MNIIEWAGPIDLVGTVVDAMKLYDTDVAE
jgi:hypothetical protein